MSADQSFGLGSGDAATGAQTEAQQMLEAFWGKVVEDINKLTANDFKSQELPLARIKKIMKLDDDVKVMVSMTTSLQPVSDTVLLWTDDLSRGSCSVRESG